MKSSNHRKIARGSSVFQRSALYDVEDHLLMVRGTYLEEYRRFYFRDIKAALVRERRSKTVLSVILLVCLIFFCAVLFLSGSAVALSFGVVFGIITLLLIAQLAPGIFGGGFCRLYIVTNVQNEPIDAVSSWLQAERVVALIRAKSEIKAEPSAGSADDGENAPRPA